jgi:hypothetical protein
VESGTPVVIPCYVFVRAGAAEMELMRRRPGEAWARHCGARAGVGEAAQGREIVQVRGSIPPTSSPLRAAVSPMHARAAFAETAPKGSLQIGLKGL